MEHKAKVLILTGQPIEREDLGRFIVDLSSMTFHKDRFSIDFNHNDELPLGVLEDVHYEEGVGLVGQATFSAPNENDKAAEIVQRLIDGYPFEVSPTLELDITSAVTLEEGQTKEVNGYEVNGPTDIYYNVSFRGCGIVLFGTDPNTSVTSLKQTNLITLNTNQTHSIKEQPMKKTKCEQDVKAPEIIADAPVADGGEEVKEQPEYLQLLEQMIEEFGEEAGIRYFRKGLSIEEAEKADYEELKAMRAKLAAGEGGCTDDEDKGSGDEATGTAGGDSGNDTAKEGTDSVATDKEELKAELKTLKAELTKLRAAFSSRGESTPVSGSTARTPDTRDALHKMADKIKANGIKRA